MKTILTIIGLAILAVIIFFVIGGNTADAPTNTATSTDEVATSTEAELEANVSDGEYTVDTENSIVTWKAEKSFVDGYADSGFIPVSTGTITVAEGVVATSSITLNVAEITATETSNINVGVDRLTSHLRSDDFFATEEFPEASFTVTNIEAVEGSETTYNVTGDLTIKGETNEITFPAEIGMDDSQLVVSGSTVIDRTEWDVRFRSPSFFNDLGDNAIADEVSITFDLVTHSTAN
ncbi:MAG: YceI family protein [Candidatus Paceibacterota bacterium]